MADSKITALASIGTGTDPANDPLVIVDVSDVSPGGMSATGTTKKVTLNNLLACSPTATLASATITGNLTVDTSTLFVNSANDRVGIGLTSPTQKLELRVTPATNGLDGLRVSNGTESIDAFITGATYSNYGVGGNTAWLLSGTNSLAIGPYGSPGIVTIVTGGNERYRIASTGEATWSNVGGVAGTAMTLNATGLGVGVSPSYKLDVQGQGIRLNSGSATGFALLRLGGTASDSFFGFAGNANDIVTGTSAGDTVIGSNKAGANLRFISGNGSLNATLDASGILLIGTTNNVIWNTTNQGCVVGGNAVQASRSNDVSLLLNRIGSNGKIAAFAREGLEVGDISVTTTGTTFNSTSDYRLKEDVQPLVGGLARVSALKPSIYKWKSNGSSGEGFLAHELAEVVPAAVSGEKDALNEDGSIKAQSIDMSRVVPILVAAIQELAAEVNALKKA